MGGDGVDDLELQPVAPVRRGRAGRVRWWSAILGPVIVLVAVAGLGLFGGSTSNARPLGLDTPTAAPDLVAIASRAPNVAPSTPAPPTPTPTPDPSPIALPETIHGLDVLDVVAARRLGQTGETPERLVAVDGWLAVAPGDPRCESPQPLPCGRTGLLGASRELDGSALVVESLPGVPLLGLTRQSPSIGMWTVPNRAIVIGRFVAIEQPGCIGPPRCGPVLRIERLAWLRTTARAAPVVMGPGAIYAKWSPDAAEATGRHSLREARELGEPGETLLVALSNRSTLRVIDPLAAEAVGRGPADEPVWYLRTIVWRGDGADTDPIVGWSVIDDRTHDVLGTGLWLGPA
jgi:hypothetical protein